MKEILDYFDHYVIDLNWQVIALHPNSKIPCMRNWNSKYNPNRVREYLEKHSNCNLGLLLGNVLDVESDTIRGNKLLNKCLQDYPHPCYKSERSTHHLFSSPFNIRKIEFRDIEFRGYHHQSVLPPSVNKNGVRYTWVNKIEGVLPPLPPSLLNFYKFVRSQELNSAFESARCSKCYKKIAIHKKRFAKESIALKKYNLPWQCHNCRLYDIREDCRKIKV